MSKLTSKLKYLKMYVEHRLVLEDQAKTQGNEAGFKEQLERNDIDLFDTMDAVKKLIDPKGVMS